MHPLKNRLSAAQWLFRAAAFPCLTAWLTVRLWVLLGETLSGAALTGLAALFSLPVLFLLLRISLPQDFQKLSLVRLTRKDAGRAGLFCVGFLLGVGFDISYDMLDTADLFIGQGWFRPLCHAGNGLFFAFLILALARAAGDLRDLRAVPPRVFLAVLAVLNGITAVYILASRTVYIWDGAGYWSVARSLAEQPLRYETLRSVLVTTLHLDYNYLLAFPISLVMRLFGGSRPVFLFSVSNLYTFPALLALLALGRERKLPGPVLCALFPMLIYMGLVGFVDTAACALALWAYVIYNSSRPPISRGVMAGALLVGSFLFRRYFFFFAASFGAAALVKAVFFERKLQGAFSALFVSSALFSLQFAWTFLLEKVLYSNYDDLYSAYAVGLRNDVMITCRYFGLAFLLFLLVRASLFLFQGRERPTLVFALVQISACFLAFVSIQTHGQQHLLLYVPGLADLAAVLLGGGPLFPQKNRPAVRRRIPYESVFAGLVLLNCFIPKAQPASIQEISRPALLPSFTFYGKPRSDIDELIRLREAVDALSAEEPQTAVVLASSLDFNSETLTNLRPSLGLREPDRSTVILTQGTVDKRDALNWNIISAGYLIVGDPIQLHLGEENQRLVTILARDVLDGTGPGSNYEALPETFSLQNGAVVRIYRRVRDWSYDDCFSLSSRLTSFYPDYADLYQLPGWMIP